ncbi:MAG TPA: hypothetical protein VID47_00260 [Actinomycetota bacterium]
MNANGTAQTRITHNPATDGSPEFSPDGQTIAFASMRDGNWEIYTIRLNGSGWQRMTNNPASDTAARGRGLANGTGAVRLATRAGDDSNPDW